MCAFYSTTSDSIHATASKSDSWRWNVRGSWARCNTSVTYNVSFWISGQTVECGFAASVLRNSGEKCNRIIGLEHRGENP